MARAKSDVVARLRRAVDEALADPRPDEPALDVFTRLRTHHTERSIKAKALLELARLRQSTRRPGYGAIGAFHNGLFECDHVSPWTKSGKRVDAAVMIVGQDWSSADVLARAPPDLKVARRGFDAKFPTNANLDALLQRHFGLTRKQCYLTNLFPYIKRGSASAAIPMKDLLWAAQTFTLPEIRIVSPRQVICLGVRTFRALQRAVGAKSASTLISAIKSPFSYGSSTIHCVAHTGALGTNNRGKSRVETDWAKIAQRHRAEESC